MKIKNKTTSIFLLFLTTILFLGCPGSKRDELEFYRSKVDSLRNVINDFVIEVNHIKYEAYRENKPIQLSNVYRKYKNLFSQHDIDLINNLRKLEQRAERIERLERLKVFIYEKIVEKETIHLLDQINHLKHELKYQAGSSVFPYCKLTDLLSKEQNANKRKKLYLNHTSLFKKIQDLNLELLRERERIIIDSLNFNSYNQFAGMILQEDVNTFAKIANDFIQTTNEYYYNQLYELLRINRIPQEKFFAYDVPFITTNLRIEKLFRSDSLYNIFITTFYQMGITIDSLEYLKIYQLPFDKKKGISKINLCPEGHTLFIPEKNYLTMPLDPGSSNLKKIFFETGKLLPLINTTEKSLELKYFYRETIPLTFGNFFANLIDEPLYLNRILNAPLKQLNNFIRLQSFKKLFEARRLCADFLVELYLQDTLKSHPDTFINFYKNILGFNTTEIDIYKFYFTIDDYYYEVELLKSLFLESMLKTKTREKFGDEWFKNPSVNNYLNDFFKKSTSYNADQFLIDIGYYFLDPRFFFNEIITMNEKARKGS